MATLGFEKLMPSGTNSNKRSAVDRKRSCVAQDHAIKATTIMLKAATLARRRFIDWPPPHLVRGPTTCQLLLGLPRPRSVAGGPLWDVAVRRTVFRLQ